jgi:hypothetical protein
MASWLSEKRCRCFYFFSPFFAFSIIQGLLAYISAWNTLVGSPRLKLCLLLEPQYQCLNWSWTHLCTRPGPLCCLVVTPFSHSHLSGNLWYAYLGSILSNPVSSMVLCSISQDSLVWPELVDVGLHCWVHICTLVCRSPPGPPPQSYLHHSCWGHLLPCYSQTAWYTELCPADIMSDLQQPNNGAAGQYSSDQHGVDPMHHPGFQTPGFTRYAFTGPKLL